MTHFCLVFLVYWVFNAHLAAAVQMENWDGNVLSIRAKYDRPGAKSLQLLGMHHLTGSGTTSYMYGKGKPTAIKIIINSYLGELETVLIEIGASDGYLLKAGE